MRKECWNGAHCFTRLLYYEFDQYCSLPNGHINFEKFWQLAKQVTEFMTWKQVACPFEKHPKVIHYLQTGTILSENGIVLHFLYEIHLV